MRRFTTSQLTDLAVVLASTGLVLAAAVGLLPATLLESVGFATGAVSVWLVVRESIWTWPVGIANNLVFIVLFLEARLYADMALQFVYVAMSIGGWLYWGSGGRAGRRRIGRVAVPEAAAVTVVTLAATYGLTLYLRSVDDSAPFLDALTTSLSLAAMYLMARKLLENWFVWIAADIIYIPLYAWKELALTAVLYGVFLAMCVRGAVAWQKPFRHAVVAGKFYPFHAGHRYLIGEAVRVARKVSVLVCERADYSISAGVRAGWIRAAFPDIDTVVVDRTSSASRTTTRRAGRPRRSRRSRDGPTPSSARSSTAMRTPRRWAPCIVLSILTERSCPSRARSSARRRSLISIGSTRLYAPTT